MLQALEREPEEAPSRTLVTSTEVSESLDYRVSLKFKEFRLWDLGRMKDVMRFSLQKIFSSQSKRLH